MVIEPPPPPPLYVYLFWVQPVQIEIPCDSDILHLSYLSFYFFGVLYQCWLGCTQITRYNLKVEPPGRQPQPSSFKIGGKTMKFVGGSQQQTPFFSGVGHFLATFFQVIMFSSFEIIGNIFATWTPQFQSDINILVTNVGNLICF